MDERRPLQAADAIQPGGADTDAFAPPVVEAHGLPAQSRRRLRLTSANFGCKDFSGASAP